MLLHVHEWGDAGAPPIVCLHGVTAHGRRFRRLAEEVLTPRFRVLAPDFRGHGRSGWEPPWTYATHADDVLETLDSLGVGPAPFLGHSFGGRMVLELAARAPERVERAILLDPVVDVLPHVAFRAAEDQRPDRSYAAPEDAVVERLAMSELTPREAVEEELREHLVEDADGRWRFRYCQGAAVSIYAEAASPAPPPETLRVPTLLVHAPGYGLVRDDHLEAYGARVEPVAVPGGHIVYWDAWDETTAALARFLGV